MKKEYINFFKKSFKFLLIFLVIEIALGSIARVFFFSQETGKHARITNSILKTEADLFVFGSSHAARHYVPAVLEEELGLTACNAGVLGQKLLFHASLFELILQRTTPKAVILNIDENWLFEAEDAYERLTDLSPFYWEYEDILAPKLRLYSKMEPLKLHFRSYQYNSTLVHALKYMWLPQPDDNGYIPLHGKMTPVDISGAIAGHPDQGVEDIDPNFVDALERIIFLAQKHQVELIFVRSPNVWGSEGKSVSYDLIKEKADQGKILFLDFDGDERFVANFDLFNDGAHLNDDGARLLSALVADAIRASKKYEKVAKNKL